ncbi:hypothetical protein AciX9_3327 [Granulicella tundricola MP5ACTX9]|uniref:Uncharacterized protein n=1 Tax=Granulicella tundricola (strain ATCC BAA-1859 / DSM 23138 / MP5ACTX9) TaxID=1198114 RepID=E8X2N9_GRATM|nr:hypothetical protein AciX9_3327 [Granulicella tundricola MP5ACTX9]
MTRDPQLAPKDPSCTAILRPVVATACYSEHTDILDTKQARLALLELGWSITLPTNHAETGLYRALLSFADRDGHVAQTFHEIARRHKQKKTAFTKTLASLAEAKWLNVTKVGRCKKIRLDLQRFCLFALFDTDQLFSRDEAWIITQHSGHQVPAQRMNEGRRSASAGLFVTLAPPPPAPMLVVRDERKAMQFDTEDKPSAGMGCQRCKAAGHFCQSRGWAGEEPLCLECGSNLPCERSLITRPLAVDSLEARYGT